MFRLVLLVATLAAGSAHAADTDTDTAAADTDTAVEMTDGATAAELAGDSGGSGCDVAGGAGLGVTLLAASIVAASRARAR